MSIVLRWNDWLESWTPNLEPATQDYLFRFRREKYRYGGKLLFTLKFQPALVLYIWTLTFSDSTGTSNARRGLLCLEKAAKQSGSKSNAVAYSSRSTSSPGPQVLPLWWLENGRREKNPKEKHEVGRRVSTYDYSISLFHWYWPITDLLQVVGWGVLYLSKRIVGAICSVMYLFI